jgi:hypothetical protein
MPSSFLFAFCYQPALGFGGYMLGHERYGSDGTSRRPAAVSMRGATERAGPPWG